MAHSSRNIRVLSLAILLVISVVVVFSVQGAFAQVGYGSIGTLNAESNIGKFHAALTHCNSADVENQSCCKALNALDLAWNSLLGRNFVDDLFKCGVITQR
ncbi:hypothetical protein A4A49_37040 [Nicotiana attenuata]|uniref:Prolamin-like domain-containing protein n=1 Tax=Nicotiana attenuata TaxID=49451 RepID=A0A1J6KEN3_NICAT|nr:hypothetical protein A4A49_37040 [Nicotiana attenuata]